MPHADSLILTLVGGFVLAFLAKARPEWVGGPVNHSGAGNTSSNGTSH